MTALFLVLALLLPQEARYLRCESPADIEFYDESRNEWVFQEKS